MSDAELIANLDYHLQQRTFGHAYRLMTTIVIAECRDRLEALARERDELRVERDRLASEVTGYKRVYDLWNKGMESTCEDRDRLKQEVRTLQRDRDQILVNFYEFAVSKGVFTFDMKDDVGAARDRLATVTQSSTAESDQPPST